MLLVDSKVESTVRYLCILSVTLSPGAKPPNVHESLLSWLRMLKFQNHSVIGRHNPIRKLRRQFIVIHIDVQMG